MLSITEKRLQNNNDKSLNNTNIVNDDNKLISEGTTDVKLVSPIKSYKDAESSKNEVLKDNRGQAGVYR
jgi:hypothetical protein